MARTIRNTLLRGLPTVAILIACAAWLLTPKPTVANTLEGRELLAVGLEDGLVSWIVACENEEITVVIDRIVNGKVVDPPKKVRVQFLTGITEKGANIDVEQICSLEKLNDKPDSPDCIRVVVPRKVKGQYAVRIKMDR